MPDVLQATGAISSALSDALDQIYAGITARFVNPDGSPSGTAVYMHLPMGISIDPKEYANPWTPAGGSAYASMSNTGGFKSSPRPAPAAGTDPTPAGQLSAIASPDEVLAASISSAYRTAQLVDNMLVVTRNGIAKDWPQYTVSIAYFTALQGMQAEPIPEPSAEIKQRIEAAQRVLYEMDAEGDFTGYTPKYAAYRHNSKELEDTRSAYASAYWAAMADPIAGRAWPVTSARYRNAIDSAYDDWRNMGAQAIEDAIATLQSIGGNAAAALIAKARKMYDTYGISLAGSVGDKVPWSYISPISWWDHTNKNFGVNTLDIKTERRDASRSDSKSSFAEQFNRNRSSSTSGSVKAKPLLFGPKVSASAAHSKTSHDYGTSTRDSSKQAHEDRSSFATLKLEWFVATIERPWLLGSLFNMGGWYMAGGKKGMISDGTIDGQLEEEGKKKLLPMIPRAFVVVRNVKITADDWGEMGKALSDASSSTSGHTDSQSTSYSGSVDWFSIAGGSASHASSASSGKFGQKKDSAVDSTFKFHKESGTLELMGGQIVGWIGEVIPEAPLKDDPELAEE
jgi:hypothetical protein